MEWRYFGPFLFDPQSHFASIYHVSFCPRDYVRKKCIILKAIVIKTRVNWFIKRVKFRFCEILKMWSIASLISMCDPELVYDRNKVDVKIDPRQACFFQNTRCSILPPCAIFPDLLYWGNHTTAPMHVKQSGIIFVIQLQEKSTGNYYIKTLQCHSKNKSIHIKSIYSF